MSNLFRWIFGLALALAAANYIIFAFAALIDLIRSLLTSPSSYICIFSILFGSAYKLSRVMPNLFSNLGGVFISAIVDDISSRITSPIISYATGLIGHLLGHLRWNRSRRNAGLMIIARDLQIEHSEKYECWHWVNDPSEQPRFTEVAELFGVWWFDIKARMNFLGLSANTKYGAYLIFRTNPDSTGLDTIQNASVSVGEKGSTNYVCLKPTTATPHNVGRPVEWSDGWMELELGQFECDNVTGDKEAVISIRKPKASTTKSPASSLRVLKYVLYKPPNM